MLKGIPKILSPEMLKVLCEMGHGDKILIADGNFPSESMGKNSIVLRADGHNVPEILEAIMQVFPLDSYTQYPITLMDVIPGDAVRTPIWETYKNIINNNMYSSDKLIKKIERFDFYSESKNAYAIIATGEKAQYANIMLQKGVITD